MYLDSAGSAIDVFVVVTGGLSDFLDFALSYVRSGMQSCGGLKIVDR